MSTEATQKKAQDASANRINYILLDNAPDTVAGSVAEIEYNGEYIVNIEGNFATAATVSLYVKRATSDEYILLHDLVASLSAQFTRAGDFSAVFVKGDKVYAQLGSITGTPAISVKMTYYGI